MMQSASRAMTLAKGTRLRRELGRRKGLGLRKDAGLTLIELMVVVVILALLAVVIVPRVIDRPDQARAARAQADIAALGSALNLYRLDTGSYPSTEQGLQALTTRPTPAPANWADGGYLERVPQDPWGRPYLYLSPGVHGSFDVVSQGADGRAGGTGTDADITSWQGE